MADKIVFNAPHTVAPPATTMELVAIHKRRKPWALHIELMDDQGRTMDLNYGGDTAKQVIKQLNTANNTTKSEDRRVLEWLVSTGVLSAGTYQPVPDEPAAPPVEPAPPAAPAAPAAPATP